MLVHAAICILALHVTMIAACRTNTAKVGSRCYSIVSMSCVNDVSYVHGFVGLRWTNSVASAVIGILIVAFCCSSWVFMVFTCKVHLGLLRVNIIFKTSWNVPEEGQREGG